MVFCGYLGEDNRFQEWESALGRYGEWLGLVPRVGRYRMGEQTFAYGWLTTGAPTNESRRADGDRLHLTTRSPGRVKVEKERGQAEGNWVQVEASRSREIIEVCVPPCTPEQFVYTRDRKACYFSNDIRFLMQWRDADVNRAGVLALFQYGAIPPPLTIGRGIKRVPGGHCLKVTGSGEPQLQKTFRPTSGQAERVSSDDPGEQVVNALDRVLSRAPRDSILYFSGGVDSGLLAWRLAEMGRTDVTLLNYSFGEEDEEAQLADRMADHLGLDLVQVHDRPGSWTDVLKRLGRDYSYPFGDYSLLPTNVLVHASLDHLEPEQAVIDGTGADGAFGIATKVPRWKRVCRIPRMLRKGLSWGYRALELWKYDNNIEYAGRIMRRSVQLPLLQAAVVAQNPLEGIGYHIPEKEKQRLQNAMRHYVQELGSQLPLEEQFSLLDLSHVCAGEFAAKTFDPIRGKGIEPIYPYLEPEMVQLALSLPWEEKSWNGEAKALLKRVLSQGIPREWVYRPKSGFTPPVHAILARDEVQAFVREKVMTGQNPILRLVEEEVTQEMLDRVRKGRSLGLQTDNFLWVFIMISIWMESVDSININ